MINFLRRVDNDVLNQIWIQQDGASAHRSRVVTEYLNVRFSNKWIMYRSQIQEWPPRSTILRFLFLLLFIFISTLKTKFIQKSMTVKNMKERIKEKCRNIDAGVLQKVRNNFRLELCKQVNGQVFEYLK